MGDLAGYLALPRAREPGEPYRGPGEREQRGDRSDERIAVLAIREGGRAQGFGARGIRLVLLMPACARDSAGLTVLVSLTSRGTSNVTLPLAFTLGLIFAHPCSYARPLSRKSRQRWLATRRNW